MREFRDDSRARWAFLQRNGQGAENEKLAVFVHGFLGSHLGTWGKLPDFLRECADEEPPFDQWDYLFLGYSTWKIQTYLDIAEIVGTQARLALQGRAPFRHKYTTLAFFAHSLGTLGLRQLLCDHTLSKDLLTAVRSVTLFAPPLNGSPLAWVAPCRIAAALVPSSAQLRMLRKWTQGAFELKRWPEVRVIVGLNDFVTGSDSASFVDWEGDRKPVDKFSLGHFDMKEPGDNAPLVRGSFEEALR